MEKECLEMGKGKCLWYTILKIRRSFSIKKGKNRAPSKTVLKALIKVKYVGIMMLAIDYMYLSL